jgi:PQQ-dependent dehydrogenase (methanol/ethanol family)
MVAHSCFDSNCRKMRSPPISLPCRIIRSALIGCFFAGYALAAFAHAAAPPTNSEWRVIGRTADDQHYSPLTQINARNVSRLSLAWWADIPTPDGLVGEPLVADGVVYQSGVPSVVFANSVMTGKLLWTFDPGVQYHGWFVQDWGSRTNRGLALWKDKVYVATGDGRLVGINRFTGKEVWEANVCKGDGQLTITGAPRVGGGKVFIGSVNADTGTARAFIDAYNAETGKRIWRFYVIPGDPSKGFASEALERAAKTWGKGYWKIVGNGSVYEGITYDRKLNLLYFGTASAIPVAPIDRGEERGDELYTSAVVAVDANTGKYVWHYTETPDDAWDYDSNAPITIADLKLDGKLRRVVLHAPKNGFFYVLDAATGKLISADTYGPRVSWASGVDQKTGRPIELRGARYYEMKSGTAWHYPGGMGARGTLPQAFSPLTGLTYLPTIDAPGASSYAKKSTAGGTGPEAGTTQIELNTPAIVADARTQLVAWDPVRREARWTVNEGLPIFGGPLVTAGNLVFAGKGSLLRAFDAETGKVLWSYRIPGGILAPPVTVQIDGEQLVLFAIGNNGASALTDSVSAPFVNDGAIRNAPSRLLAFKLGGRVVLPPTDLADVYPRPPLPRFPSALAEQGRRALKENGCNFCHGGDSLDAVGSVPNLKKLNAATEAALARIVIGDALKAGGMPDFSYLDADTVKAIQAYVINQAWDAYDAQRHHAD